MEIENRSQLGVERGLENKLNAMYLITNYFGKVLMFYLIIEKYGNEAEVQMII